MAVLPENMDRLDKDNVAGSLSVLENYIRYMGERIEFSMGNVTRQVSAAGVSNAEIYVLITAINNSLSALQSTVNGLRGTVTGLAGGQGELQDSLDSLEGAVTALQTSVTNLQGSLGQAQTALESQGAEITALRAGLTALEERVTTLETPEPEPEISS